MGVGTLIGERFGLLVVEGPSTVRPISKHRLGTILQCKCDCGTIAHIPKKELLNNDRKSCGCLTPDPVVVELRNRTIGHLQILHPLAGQDVVPRLDQLWRCYCQACGEYTLLPKREIKYGHRTSCGCQLRLRPHRIKYKGGIYTANALARLTGTKAYDIRRWLNINPTLTGEELIQHIQKSNNPWSLLECQGDISSPSKDRMALPSLP